MAETDEHYEQMVYLIEALKLYFADRPDVYVAGNNFLYWEQGNPKAVISPGCYVVFGVEKKLRKTYLAWRENGILPTVVFEVTSRKTRRQDTHRKRPIYEGVLRVSEYYLFDPTGDYLKPRLQGFLLVDGAYVAMERVENRLHSDALGLDLVWQGRLLRLYDPEQGEFLPTIQEAVHRAEVEARRADAAEQENARLRAELEALRQQKG
jgi:Uma2 family endonuclease